MIELWSAVAVAVLTVVVGPVLRGEFGNRSTRRLTHHAALRSSLVGNDSALGAIDELVTLEASKLRDRELRRLNRKVDGSSVGALIFVTVVGSGLVYGLLATAFAVGNPVWYWVLIALAIASGIFTVGLSMAGATTVFKYPEDAKSTKQ